MGSGRGLTPPGEDFDHREFSWLWLIALSTYGVGDVVTTIAVVRYAPHVEEMNAAVRASFAALGEGGFAGLKLVAFLVCLVISLRAAANHDRVLYYLPPSLLAVVGMVVTVHNIQVLMA